MRYVALFCLLLALLCGCNGSREVENRDFVLGGAVEKSGENYKVYAAIAVLSYDSNESGREVTIKTGSGKTVSEAFENLDAATSGKLFFGQCALMICNENAVDDMTDFCKNNNEMSKNVILLKGENIKTILATRCITGSVADFAEDYYDNNEDVRKVTLNDYLMAKSKNKVISIPVITSADNEIKIQD